MVLLRDKDDLSAYKGLVTEAFGSQRLTYLQERFISSAPEEAISLLATFYAAADDLRTSENAFNSRARKGGPDLKGHLRNSEQFAAIKGFNAAKEGLLGMDNTVGQQIVSLVEKSITAKKSAKRAFTG